MPEYFPAHQLLIGGFPVTLVVQDSFGERGTQDFTIQICPDVFASTGSMKAARESQTATLLNDGRVLVTGGSDPNGASIATAELFDPSTDTFTPTGSMAAARATECGTTVAWCLNVSCTQGSLCGIHPPPATYIECVVGGCGDIITSSYCTSCSA